MVCQMTPLSPIQDWRDLYQFLSKVSAFLLGSIAPWPIMLDGTYLPSKEGSMDPLTFPSRERRSIVNSQT
jgi:hypothetical protein